MAATTRQKSGWITANIVVILLVLIPVLWIFSLSTVCGDRSSTNPQAVDLV